MRSEARFKFGENWASYAKGVSEDQIASADIALRRLVPDGTLAGKRFLDIGSGSGLHSVVAVRLGAKEVTAIDIDPISVQTTRQLVALYTAGANVRVEQRSVFDIGPEEFGKFDVVYSWGVLHHTGNMAKAIRHAAALVEIGGEFVVALYRRTWLCPFWRMEKRWYAQTSPENQDRARRLFIAAMRLAFAFSGRNFRDYIAEHDASRGMDFYHDVHDWLGGYPYESASRFEIDRLMRSLGFRARIVPKQRRRLTGLFGSGCDEYVYIRTA